MYPNPSGLNHTFHNHIHMTLPSVKNPGVINILKQLLQVVAGIGLLLVGILMIFGSCMGSTASVYIIPTGVMFILGFVLAILGLVILRMRSAFVLSCVGIAILAIVIIAFYCRTSLTL